MDPYLECEPETPAIMQLSGKDDDAPFNFSLAGRLSLSLYISPSLTLLSFLLFPPLSLSLHYLSFSCLSSCLQPAEHDWIILLLSFSSFSNGRFTVHVLLINWTQLPSFVMVATTSVLIVMWPYCHVTVHRCTEGNSDFNDLFLFSSVYVIYLIVWWNLTLALVGLAIPMSCS